VEDFRFCDIRDGDDFDIVIFEREVIEVSTDLAQSHNADSNSSITHDCSSVPRED
jgi:hypothetical protein